MVDGFLEVTQVIPLPCGWFRFIHSILKVSRLKFHFYYLICVFVSPQNCVPFGYWNCETIEGKKTRLRKLKAKYHLSSDAAAIKECGMTCVQRGTLNATLCDLAEVTAPAWNMLDPAVPAEKQSLLSWCF